MTQETRNATGRRRPRRPRPSHARNRAQVADAVYDDLDLSDRESWERTIRAAGGLKIGREDRGDFQDVPFYLKDYKHGKAPDEIVQEIADARGLKVRQVEDAMLGALSAPKERGPRRDEVPEELRGAVGADEWAGMGAAERRATVEFFRAGAEEEPDPERKPRHHRRPRHALSGVIRPTVELHGDTFTLRPRSPWKGVVSKVNAPRRALSSWPSTETIFGLALAACLFGLAWSTRRTA